MSESSAKRIKLAIEVAEENAIKDITDDGEEIVEEKLSNSEKLDQITSRINFEALLDSSKSENDKNLEYKQNDNDTDMEKLNMEANKQQNQIQVQPLEKIKFNLYHAQQEIKLSLDIVNRLIMTSTEKGRNDKRERMEFLSKQKSSLFNQQQLQQQQLQTPDMMFDPKKNESNIRLANIHNPKLSLKQQIEEYQLKLSAKREHLRHASRILLEEHENILNILNVSQAFYNEQSETLRPNNWIIQSKNRVNRTGMLQRSLYVDYSYIHAGSRFKEMGIAQISQNRHTIANAALNKEVDSNEEKIKLLLPHKKKKVVTVEIFSPSAPKSSHRDVWATWDIEVINNKILRQLLESQITIYHNELYNRLINDAQNSYLEKKVKFSENMISLPLSSDKRLIFRIETKKDDDEPVDIKDLTSQELSQAFLELFLQEKLRNIHRKNIQKNNFFTSTINENNDQNINILSPSVSTISKSNQNIVNTNINGIKNEGNSNKKSENEKQKLNVLKENFVEQTYELILYKECIEYIKSKLDHFVKTIVSGKIPISVHFEKIFNDKTENTLETETQILITFFNNYTVKFGIKFPTKVVFYLNRQDTNDILNCHEVKNGFIKFLIQELKIICLKVICNEAKNSGITGNEKWEVDDIVGNYLKGIINFQEKIGVFEVITHSNIDPLELSFDIKCHFNGIKKSHTIHLNTNHQHHHNSSSSVNSNHQKFNYFSFFINDIQKIFVNDIILNI
jgi:hypothetical protein